MAKTAKDANCGLRAHMKTHKTLEIGQLMAPDKRKITVSTLSEAEFFADGTDDLELDIFSQLAYGPYDMAIYGPYDMDHIWP